MAATVNYPKSAGTVSGSAIPLTDAAFGFSQDQVDKAWRAWITSNTNNVRYLDNGDSPTATIGHVFEADKTTEFSGVINQLEFISEGSDTTVVVELETTGVA